MLTFAKTIKDMITIHESEDNFICDIQAPCFQTLNQQEADLIKSGKTQLLFKKGETLSKQGAFASYILFIIKGTVKQYIEDASGKQFNISILKSGDYIGLSALFNTHTFSCSTTALNDCQAYLIEKKPLIGVIKSNGSFGFQLIQRYGEESHLLLSKLQHILYKQMNGRIAEVLLYLNNEKNHCPEIFQLLSRKEIAEFCGISTENAIKVLKTFEKDGLIILQDKDIILKDQEQLTLISKRG